MKEAVILNCTREDNEIKKKKVKVSIVIEREGKIA